MKKFYMLLVAFTAVASAYAVNTGDSLDGDKRICYYSDGSVITVSGSENCPVSID